MTPPPKRDPGLQAERTALAWSRTALAVFVNAALILRAGWADDEPALVAAGVALLLSAAAVALAGGWRRRQLAGGPPARAVPVTAIAGVAVITGIACAAALASLARH